MFRTARATEDFTFLCLPRSVVSAPAPKTTLTPTLNANISGDQRMTAFSVRPLLRGSPTLNVYKMSDRFQVGWVYAERSIATVIQL